MNNRFGSRLRFYLEIKRAVELFDNLDYSIITGGFAKNNSRGDVDVITVLKSFKPETSKKVLEFAKRHVFLELLESFTPDFQFPTDVVSRHQISDAISGRAFEVIDGVLRLKDYSNNEIISNPEADYRIWLYEMITHDFDLVGGNFESLVDDTLEALKTTFLWAAQLYKYQKVVNIEKLRSDIFSAAGLSYKLSEKQYRCLLIMLEKEKFGVIKSGEEIFLNSTNIQKEISKLKFKVRNNKTFTATHILQWSTIRNYVIN